MGQKKDIGTLFETKLKQGKKIPNENIWEKINASLDEEKRKKRRFLYWFTGISALALVGVYLVLANDLQSRTESQTRQNYQKEESSNPSEKIGTNNSSATILQDTLKRITVENQQFEMTSSSKKSIGKEEKIPSKTIDKNSKDKTSVNTEINETFTVSKKYHYYNSRDGKKIVTEDEREIDSLISKKPDTINFSNPETKNDGQN